MSFSVLEAQEISLLSGIKQDSALDVYLTLDWKSLEKNKKDKTYSHASIRLDDGMDSIVAEVKVRTRGHMRLEICSYPPLKLKFDKSTLARNGFSEYNELDIVHPCHSNPVYEQYLLREYLAYKLWELVSPYYFRVQLIRLHYLNEDGTTAHDPTYAFLVEHMEELVTRYAGRITKMQVIASTAVEKESMLKVALFEFMIGNTDWFILNRHNLEFVGIPGHSLLVTIPYDFDYSGLVSAPYAAHHESLDLSTVDVRYYQGWCHTQEEVDNVLSTFREKKQAILSLPYHIQGFDERSVKHTTAFLHGFFDVIETPAKLKNQVIKHCDMWPVSN